MERAAPAPTAAAPVELSKEQRLRSRANSNADKIVDGKLDQLLNEIQNDIARARQRNRTPPEKVTGASLKEYE